MESSPPHKICTDMVRQEDRDRFLCGMFAPAPCRTDLFVLYAFNLEIARVRETVSEPIIGQMRLQWWRDNLDRIYQKQPPQHPVAEGLTETIHKYNLSRVYFNRLIDGREFDLVDEPPEDLPALISYADSTSTPLIQLALEVLGCSGKFPDDIVRQVGILWSLTGLLRAVPFHAANNRAYLPKDLLSAAGINPENIMSFRHAGELPAVIEKIAGLADRALIEARQRWHGIPKQAAPALLLATLAEQDLRRLRKSGYNAFAPNLQRRHPGDVFKLILNGFRGSY